MTDKKDEKKTVSVVNKEEQQYLDMVKYILEKGIYRMDRTKIGRISTFGNMMKFSLRNGSFPLLGTKKVEWKLVVSELKWILGGCTDVTILTKQGNHIWDDWVSREYLDAHGFKDRAVGDSGPSYPHAFRHYNAKYIDCKTDYTGQGVDQVAMVIDLIKNNPTSSRILINAWNPSEIDNVSLPPCHITAQFYVANGELSCHMNQRSADMMLGVPFNIASYSLLTCLFAHHTGLKPGEFTHTLGDTHVYSNHVEPAKIQLARTPGSFPTLSIKKDSKWNDLSDFTIDELELKDYHPQEKIKFKIAV